MKNKDSYQLRGVIKKGGKGNFKLKGNSTDKNVSKYGGKTLVLN